MCLHQKSCLLVNYSVVYSAIYCSHIYILNHLLLETIFLRTYEILYKRCVGFRFDGTDVKSFYYISFVSSVLLRSLDLSLRQSNSIAIGSLFARTSRESSSSLAFAEPNHCFGVRFAGILSYANNQSEHAIPKLMTSSKAFHFHYWWSVAIVERVWDSRWQLKGVRYEANWKSWTGIICLQDNLHASLLVPTN